MKLSRIFMAAAAASTIMLSSCYDLDRYPDSQLSSGTFFKTENHAKQATMGVYSSLRNDQVYGLAFGWDCLGGISFGYDNPSFQTFQRGTVAANNSYITNKWSALYEGIARSNNVIQNVDGCDMTDQLKNQYKAEARFLRALFYFNLMEFYGGVPIYDESVVVAEDFANMLNPRSSLEETRDFIIADLDAAAMDLPAAWDAANYGRATSGAAIALKGKTLLYAGRYQEASECFAKVINSGNYALYPNYADLFKPAGHSSSEMIFAVQNIGGLGQDYGMPLCFYLGTRASFGSCWNNIMPATSFVDSFEWADGRPFDWNEVVPGFNESNSVKAKVFYSTLGNGKKSVEKYTEYKETLLDMYSKRDPRMSASIILPYTHYTGWSKNASADHEYIIAKGMGIPSDNGMINVNGNHEAYLWRKFVPEANMNGAINNRAHTPINFPIIRLADVLLMQAECLNELGKQDEAVALINQVRARAGMPGLNSGPAYLNATGKDEIFSRIRHERAIELCCEGHSFFDMKRWGLLETLNDRKELYITGAKALYTRKVTTRDYLWAIPLGEIDKNPLLEQNPGW